jgi:hypothetical protein
LSEALEAIKKTCINSHRSCQAIVHGHKLLDNL